MWQLDSTALATYLYDKNLQLLFPITRHLLSCCGGCSPAQAHCLQKLLDPGSGALEGATVFLKNVAVPFSLDDALDKALHVVAVDRLPLLHLQVARQ